MPGAPSAEDDTRNSPAVQQLVIEDLKHRSKLKKKYYKRMNNKVVRHIHKIDDLICTFKIMRFKGKAIVKRPALMRFLREDVAFLRHIYTIYVPIPHMQLLGLTPEQLVVRCCRALRLFTRNFPDACPCCQASFGRDTGICCASYRAA